LGRRKDVADTIDQYDIKLRVRDEQFDEDSFIPEATAADILRLVDTEMQKRIQFIWVVVLKAVQRHLTEDLGRLRQIFNLSTLGNFDDTERGTSWVRSHFSNPRYFVYRHEPAIPIIFNCDDVRKLISEWRLC